MLKLVRVYKSSWTLNQLMKVHYSKPKGFVGRQLHYLIKWNDVNYGAICAGNCTLHLPGRDKFFGITPLQYNTIVNNTFFHVEKVDGRYPCREFVPKIIASWRQYVIKDWYSVYLDKVLGFETLVELPRTGECYRRDGWSNVGETKGFTCKREAGSGTDSWSGSRVWDVDNLRPKLVFCRSVEQ